MSMINFTPPSYRSAASDLAISVSRLAYDGHGGMHASFRAVDQIVVLMRDRRNEHLPPVRNERCASDWCPWRCRGYSSYPQVDVQR